LRRRGRRWSNKKIKIITKTRVKMSRKMMKRINQMMKKKKITTWMMTKVCWMRAWMDRMTMMELAPTIENI
jgi:hypothetical protein